MKTETHDPLAPIHANLPPEKVHECLDAWAELHLKANDFSIPLEESTRCLHWLRTKGPPAMREQAGDIISNRTREVGRRLYELTFLPPDPEPVAEAPVNEDGHETGSLIIVRAADVKPEKVDWLWENRLPLGAVSLLDGPPGLGKSTLCCELAARVSHGQALPGSEAKAPRGVLIYTAEDSVAQTLRPRLEAAGADLNRVHFIGGVRLSGGERGLLLPTDVWALAERIKALDVALVIVDPLTATLNPTTDTHREGDVRQVMSRLRKLAEETGVALVGIRHVRKTSGGGAVNAGLGSIGFSAAARSVLMAGKHPGDAKKRVLAVGKCNLGMAASLAYRLEVHPANKALHVVWEGEVGVSADDLVAPEEPRVESAISRAEKWLGEALAHGPLGAEEVLRQAKEAGIGKTTIQQVKSTLGVRSTKGKDGWTWALKDAA